LKILINTQYFWPETFRINDVVKFLQEKGYSIDILTGEPNYPDGKLFSDYIFNKKKFNKFYDSRVYRVPIITRGAGGPFRLFLNYLSYVISAILIGSFILRKNKYDLILTFATSPISVAIPSLFFSWIKNAKHILWVLDLWPDILKELGIVKSEFSFKVLNKIINYFYKKSDIILAQSKSFTKIIKERVLDKIKVVHFPSWSEDLGKENQQKESSYLEKRIYENKFNIVFTGNVGEAQNFDNIIEAANLLRDKKDIQWIIVGAGRKLDHIKRRIVKKKIDNFLILGHRPISEINFFHRIANVLLVSLMGKDYLSCTIPGKISTYMQSKKSILGFIKGDAAELIKESKAGVVVNPNSPIALANTIEELKNNPVLLRESNIGTYTEEYIKKHLNKKIILNSLLELIEDLNNSFEEIKIINSTENIPFNRNFSLSGLNLAFLGYYTQKKIKITKNVYLWPDGIFFNRFFYNKLKKIPGRNLISNLNLPAEIKRVFIFGNLDQISLVYIQNLYKKEVIHVKLGFEDVEYLYANSCHQQFLETDIIIITLPTPKQEEFSQLIMMNHNFYKIFCVGGAINMAAGVEKPIPYILEKTNLEFLWRLRTDTKRRIKRLIVSAYYYFLGELSFKFYNIKKKIINEK
jgi:colanic acid biosynthesis glycosyl transferase WcaI